MIQNAWAQMFAYIRIYMYVIYIQQCDSYYTVITVVVLNAIGIIII